MQDLVDYRWEEVKKIVPGVLKHVAGTIKTARQDDTEAAALADVAPTIDEADRVFAMEHGFEDAEGIERRYLIKVIAPGSDTLTSDIDMTMIVHPFPEFEFHGVKEFNKAFEARWSGQPSGIVFDVNLYTSGFMPDTTIKGAPEFKEKFHVPEDKKHLIKEQKRAKSVLQLGLSLVPIVQYLRIAKGSSYEEDVTALKDRATKIIVESSDWKDYLGDRGETAKAEAKQLVSDSFDKAVDLYQETNRTWAMAVMSDKSQDLSYEAVDMKVSNKLYQQELEKAAAKLVSMKTIRGQIAVAEGTNSGGIDALYKKHADEVVSFVEIQGKALIYANEAYMSLGAAEHVVLGMQGGKAPAPLGRQKQLQSLLHQAGYLLLHFHHQTDTLDKKKQGQALVSTSKYLVRFGDLMPNTKDLSVEEENTYRENRKSPNIGFGLGGNKLSMFQKDLIQLAKRAVVIKKKIEPHVQGSKGSSQIQSYTSMEAHPSVDEPIVDFKKHLETQLFDVVTKAFLPYLVDRARPSYPLVVNLPSQDDKL